MASDQHGTMVGGFQVNVGGFSSAWAVCGRGVDTMRTQVATSQISRCHPTEEEEEESLADDGEEEELRQTWRRASTNFAPIRISI